jgi:hypothetical protein
MSEDGGEAQPTEANGFAEGGAIARQALTASGDGEHQR